MSKQAAPTEVSLKPKSGEGQGKLVIVRASELDKNGTTGTVAEGILEKKEPNKFNPAKNDYFIRDAATDTLYIVNSTQGLAEQLEQEGVLGNKVRIEYEGKVATKNKKGYHQFSCFLTK